MAREEIVIATGTVLGSGEPAAGPTCGQQELREYTPGSAPDVEHTEGQRRQLSAIARLHRECFTVQLDQSTRELVCRRDDMLEQLRWQKDRFGAARSDDTDQLVLYDIDAAYTIQFLMARALKTAGLSRVSRRSCAFSLFRSKHAESWISKRFMKWRTGMHIIFCNSSHSNRTSQCMAMTQRHTPR